MLKGTAAALTGLAVVLATPAAAEVAFNNKEVLERCNGDSRCVAEQRAAFMRVYNLFEEVDAVEMVDAHTFEFILNPHFNPYAGAYGVCENRFGGDWLAMRSCVRTEIYLRGGQPLGHAENES